MKILVVDDDEDARYLTCMSLSDAGYAAEVAADGEQAWRALQADRFDLVVTDHQMPGLSGLELAGRIRAARMTLPIIINSGSCCLDEASGYTHLDLAAVLRKSCKWSEVVETVERVLATRPVNTQPAVTPQRRRTTRE